MKNKHKKHIEKVYKKTLFDLVNIPMGKEKIIEQKLCKKVRQIGGLALKFVSPGFDGVPDRIILIAHGRIAFVEVKAPGEKPRPLQVARIKKLKEMGFNVYLLDHEDQIGGIIDAILST